MRIQEDGILGRGSYSKEHNKAAWWGGCLRVVCGTNVVTLSLHRFLRNNDSSTLSIAYLLVTGLVAVQSRSWDNK